MIQETNLGSTTSDLFVFKHSSKRVIAKRQLCYQTAIQTCRSLFPELRGCEITFNTKDLDICDNELRVIAEESWAIIVTQLNCVVVIAEEKEDSAGVVAAPLAVSPAPDVVTLVFMIFKGISDDELAQWSTATKKASEDVRIWQAVVGVQYEHELDAKLFRVLKWEEMKILHHL